MKNYDDYPLWIKTQIKRAGGIEAWRKAQSERAKLAKTTTHGFSNPKVMNKAINNSLKSRGLKRKGVQNSSKSVDK